MAIKVKGPFAAADVEAWNRSLRNLERVREELELARAAGFPCDNEHAACQAVKAQLENLKAVYAPGAQ